MSRTRSLWLVTALVAATVLTAASITVAQQPQPSPTAAPASKMYSRLQQNLGLTDDQVTQIRAIHAQQREAQRQVWQALRVAQTDLRQLALSNGDPAAIAAKKTQIAQLLAQGMDLRVQSLQQMGPILTPEQRDKLAQMGPSAMWRGHRGAKPAQPQS